MHANTNPSQFDPATFDKTAYPAAFKHVRSLLQKSVPTAQFIYHSVRGGAQDLYPGDDVTDYIGFSIFNNDVCLACGSTANCQGSKLDPNVAKDLAWAPKPRLIAESALQAGESGGADNFVEYLTRVKSMIEKYDVRGWTYINSDWTKHGWTAATWTDSRIEANSQAMAWWKQNILGSSRYTWGK